MTKYIEIIIGWILAIAIIIFVAVLVIKRFVYFHPSNDFQLPQENYEEIVEGNVYAWFLRGGDKAVLFCHGNAGNISTRQEKIIALKNLGFSVLIFDYTGFGYSKGVPSEEKCFRDACIYADVLLKQYKKENIIVYGESLGAAVAAYVALRYTIPTLILESSLPGIKQYIKYKYPPLGLLSFLFDNFNTEKYLERYQGKVLVLHCKNDEMIPWDLTEKIRENASLVVEMSGSHNYPVVPWEEIKKFIQV